jgi:hypothetical protein
MFNVRQLFVFTVACFLSDPLLAAASKKTVKKKQNLEILDNKKEQPTKEVLAVPPQMEVKEKVEPVQTGGSGDKIAVRFDADGNYTLSGDMMAKKNLYLGLRYSKYLLPDLKRDHYKVHMENTSLALTYLYHVAWRELNLEPSIEYGNTSIDDNYLDIKMKYKFSSIMGRFAATMPVMKSEVSSDSGQSHMVDTLSVRLSVSKLLTRPTYPTSFGSAYFNKYDSVELTGITNLGFLVKKPQLEMVSLDASLSYRTIQVDEPLFIFDSSRFGMIMGASVTLP